MKLFKRLRPSEHIVVIYSDIVRHVHVSQGLLFAIRYAESNTYEDEYFDIISIRNGKQHLVAGMWHGCKKRPESE